jgi:hypothetical protein
VKRRERCAQAVEAACTVIRDLGIRGPHDLKKLELIGAARGAFVEWRELAGNEEGHLINAGRSSIVRVRASLRGTPKGNFVMAHEFGHNELHAEHDHYAMCTSESVAASGTRFRVEREASDFGSELVVPTCFAQEMCTAKTPSLDDVLAIARRFDVSFTVAALRYLDMTEAPCAFIEMRAGLVKRASATPGFRVKATRGHALVLPADARAWALPVDGTDVKLTWVAQG